MHPVIDCDFPGGNIILDRIEGDNIHIRQDLRDTEGDWFYWYFRVRGAAERTLRFRFTGSNAIGVRGPAVSLNRGRTWSWLGADAVTGVSFKYTVPADTKEVRFSFGMPYVASDLKRFLRRYQEHPSLEVSSLCNTHKGREVEQLHIGNRQTPDHRVLITARHHCCEMMASYALEGLIARILADTETGAWFRDHVECRIVPFVDKDGVEDGDQGKNRKPRDHNRDYDGEGVHATTRALREQIPKWSGNLLKIALDLHCPWIRGRHNEVIYLVGSPSEETWQQQCRFSNILQTVQTGPLVFNTADNLPFGVDWNNEANFQAGKSFTGWAREFPGIALATSIEIPYANAGGQEVNARSARAFGRDLAETLRQYLETL